MAASAGNLSKRAAVWLDPGQKSMSMTLQDGQVCVEEGELHGHYETYWNLSVQKWCLNICFSDRIRFGSRFEYQAPHHLKPLGKDDHLNVTRARVPIWNPSFVKSNLPRVCRNSSDTTKVSRCEDEQIKPRFSTTSIM